MRPIGFAVLVETDDGNRMIIYSDDVAGASLTLTQTHPFVISTSGPLDEGSVEYDMHLNGAHLNFQVNIEPLTKILEDKPRLLEIAVINNG